MTVSLSLQQEGSKYWEEQALSGTDGHVKAHLC